MSGSNDLSFISYYIARYSKESADGKIIKGAYGERIFGLPNQFERTINLLKEKPSSRRAVIQIYRSEDFDNETEVPCTISLQLLLRNGHLDLFVNMRSNDAYMGLPHDLFAFTMIQELAARKLGVNLGLYKHFVGSLHLYETDVTSAKSYVDDGLQPRVEMPPMPNGDPSESLKRVLAAEEAVRLRGAALNGIDLRGLDGYWTDIITLLRAFHYTREKDSKGLSRMRHSLNNDFYHQYIDMKTKALEKHAGPKQEALDLVIPSEEEIIN